MAQLITGIGDATNDEIKGEEGGSSTKSYSGLTAQKEGTCLPAYANYQVLLRFAVSICASVEHMCA